MSGKKRELLSAFLYNKPMKNERKKNMKAIIWTKYGSPDGLELQKIPKPVAKDNEILIKIHATTVTAGDSEMRRLQLPLSLGLPIRLYTGIRKPERIKILGQELAGKVEAIGKDVKKYKVGDQVFGTTGFGFGAHAEYICLSAEPNEMQGALTHKPKNLSFAEAAALPTAGFEALHFLRHANIQPEQKVLIFGASGSIGTFSVQLAKHFGAEVTAVDHTTKLAMLRGLGADYVIDYTQEDFTKNGKRYDVIIDVVGKFAVLRRLRALTKSGRYYLANPGLSHLLLGLWVSLTSRKKLIIKSAEQGEEALLQLKEMAEAGKLKTVIGKTFLLEETAEAHRYADTGQKLGNIVITVSREN
jgi:NADPH:quinone reductase-like Zn-dependent oxidoreductase